MVRLIQTAKVIEDNKVLKDIAATAKSESPFISFAMIYVMVAVGDAKSIRPGR